METVDTLIIGAGLAGLSASYHIGHSNCLILEKNTYPFGHIHSELRNGFTWDEGPHVSFTKNEYVRELFAESVDGNFEEHEVCTSNYFKGSWIGHPAQSNLYQIPEPLRTQCLDSFLASRSDLENASEPEDYQQWLYQAFGPVFAEAFPAAYTRKYWTLDPRKLTTEWVGSRVFRPAVADVLAGSKGPLERQTHYIKKIRYPSKGGYQAFATKLEQGANVRLSTEVVSIDLDKKIVYTSDGEVIAYNRLINTITLPIFLRAIKDVPAFVTEASDKLLCSSILLVNVTAPHPTLRPENWMYVYDEDKYSTRINCTELLSPNNAPKGHTGVQVEVYQSREKPLMESKSHIAKSVVGELAEMGIIDLDLAGDRLDVHTKDVPWANVVFHKQTAPALDCIFEWLTNYGLKREQDDLHPLTDWDSVTPVEQSGLALAGRFAQWKYYWTDDCLLRGKQLSER